MTKISFKTALSFLPPTFGSISPSLVASASTGEESFGGGGSVRSGGPTSITARTMSNPGQVNQEKLLEQALHAVANFTRAYEKSPQAFAVLERTALSLSMENSFEVVKAIEVRLWKTRLRRTNQNLLPEIDINALSIVDASADALDIFLPRLELEHRKAVFQHIGAHLKKEDVSTQEAAIITLGKTTQHFASFDQSTLASAVRTSVAERKTRCSASRTLAAMTPCLEQKERLANAMVLESNFDCQKHRTFNTMALSLADMMPYLKPDHRPDRARSLIPYVVYPGSYLWRAYAIGALANMISPLERQDRLEFALLIAERLDDTVRKVRSRVKGVLPDIKQHLDLQDRLTLERKVEEINQLRNNRPQ